jgi:1-aminocyclopropane-1-carboxylate deaminase/D-cysteine desulfhydrase-like pyridoxal-dependent ACC family enzyme
VTPRRPGRDGGGAPVTGVPLAFLPTPCHPAPRLGAALGLADLWVKRDDQTGLALGGNKARKLVRLVADAHAAGADTLVTGGGPQSNHARMTAAAAAQVGMRCELALAADPGTDPVGNLLLDHLLGAIVHPVGPLGYDELEEAIVTLGEQVRAAGRRPYVIPVGGASPVGVAAYADAAAELMAQLAGAPDWVVCADGSGGTHAGLLAGLAGTPSRVLGVDVGTRGDLDAAVARLAFAAAGGTLRFDPAPGGAVLVDHDHFGAGYGAPTPSSAEAIILAARTEGLVLDPVYTAKALAALRTWVADGRIEAGARVVFWHTGGAPALFAPRYREELMARAYASRSL